MIESEAHLKTWPTSPQHMGTAERLRCNRRGGTHREGRFAGAPSSDRNICVRWRWDPTRSWMWRAATACGGRRPAGDGGRQSVAVDGDGFVA
jgi:hypothetical protein